MKKSLKKLLSLCLMLIVLLTFFGCNQGESTTQPESTKYTINDEVTMAVSRIKNASYQADLAAIVNLTNVDSENKVSSLDYEGDNEKDSVVSLSNIMQLENKSSPKAPEYLDEDTIVTKSYSKDEIVANESFWFSMVVDQQKIANEWGVSAKNKIFSFINKVTVFDKWIYTPNISYASQDYLCFMLSYDSENDVVTLYDGSYGLETYKYYFDDNGNEVLEYYYYDKYSEGSDYEPKNYTKYIKDVCYVVATPYSYSNIENNNGKLSCISYELDKMSNQDDLGNISALVQNGAKTLFFNYNAKFDSSTMEYIFDNEMIFRIEDTKTTDCYINQQLHPVTMIEYAMNTLEGFDYLCETKNLNSPNQDFTEIHFLKQYYGDKIYSSSNPNGIYFKLGDPASNKYYYIKDFTPEYSHFYNDVNLITTNSTLSDTSVIDEINQKLINKEYLEEIVRKLVDTNCVNYFDFYQQYAGYFGSIELYNGWTVINSRDFGPLTTADIVKYYGADESENPATYNPYMTYYYNHIREKSWEGSSWSPSGGTVALYDYEGISLLDKTQPLYLKDKFVSQYYDFRNDYNNFDAYLSDVEILGVKNVISVNGKNSLLSKINELMDNEYCKEVDLNNIDYVTPDQLETVTASMLTPTLEGGEITATLSSDNNDIKLSLAQTNLKVAKNVLLEKDAEYRAELCYIHGNSIIETELKGNSVVYSGEDLVVSLNGEVIVSGNMIFDKKYQVVTIVSKKIDGKWVKISLEVALNNSQTNGTSKFILDTFGKKVGEDYSFGYGVANDEGLVLIKKGTDIIAPVISTAAGYNIVQKEEFVGEGLNIIGVVEINSSSAITLGDIRDIFTISDNINGTIKLSLENFVLYKFVEIEQDTFELVIDEEAKPFTNYLETIIPSVTVITVSDSAGNSTQIAVVRK